MGGIQIKSFCAWQELAAVVGDSNVIGGGNTELREDGNLLAKPKVPTRLPRAKGFLYGAPYQRAGVGRVVCVPHEPLVIYDFKGGNVRHINYLKYVLRHKWFVLLASIRIGAPIWGAIIHDLSKFRPSEWFPYARTFYAPDGSKQYVEGEAFARAWNDHQKRNKHHWQYWILTWDRGNTTCIPMPKNHLLEMVADWMGAGRTITGKWEAKQWYEKNCNTIQIHATTRLEVEKILNR